PVVAPPRPGLWGGAVAQASGAGLVRGGGPRGAAHRRPAADGPVRARLFAGESGWGPGQLEGEIAEGAWLVTDAPAEDILGPFPRDLWRKLLRREGGQAAIWSTHPIDPRLN